MQYCSQCGSKNIFSYIDGNNRFHCPQCQTIHYQNPKPTATLICIKNNKLLLGKRDRDPAKGQWGLIGGFMELNETLDEAALRELYEETQLKGEVINIIGTSSHYNTVFGDILLIGLLVKIDDVNQLAEAIKKVIDNKKLASSLANNGYKKFMKNYSEKAFSKNIVKIYNSIIKIKNK